MVSFRRLAALALVASSVGISHLHAATIQWNNAGGGSWSLAANWAPTLVPGPGDSVIITLPGTYTVTAPAAVTIQSLTIGAATGTQVLTTGAMTVTGTVQPAASSTGGVLNGGSVAGAGAIQVPAGQLLTLRGMTVGVPLRVDGTLELQTTCNVNGAFTSGPGSALVARSTNFLGSSVVTFANGFTNNGSIDLANTPAASGSTLNVTNGTLVNPSGRTITCAAGLSGVHTIGAQIDNQGQWTVLGNTTVNRAGADHLNSGTLALSGGDLGFTQSGPTPTLTNSGTVSIAAGRTLTVNGGTLAHNAGTMTGAGAVTVTGSASANLVASFTPGALSIQSGTLNLTPNLTTAATTLALNQATVNGPGSITNAAGVTTPMQGTTVNTPLINNGTLDLQAACNFIGAFTSGPGSAIIARGTNFLGGAVVTFASGFTNNGTIDLTNTPAAGAATLNVTNGTLVNAAGRTITCAAGAVGSHTISARLDNSGTLVVQGSTTVSKASAAHVNRGLVSVQGGDLTWALQGVGGSCSNEGTLSVAAGRTMTVNTGPLTNAATGTLAGSGRIVVNVPGTITHLGTIAPGASAGLLAIQGLTPLTPSSRLNIEIGGPLAGSGFDRLAVTGAITLDGSVNVTLINGYVPSPGDRFPVLGYTSKSGAISAFFGMDLGGGLSFKPIVTDTGIVLQAVRQAWVTLLPNEAPPLARDGHTSVMDAAGDRMIVFGGLTNAGARADVWVLEHASGATGDPAWRQLAPTGTLPAARAAHVGAYDPASNRLIVFGGNDALAGPGVFGDVWVLSNANGVGGTPVWSALAVAGGPGPRTGAAAAYDAANKRLIVFGGSASGACGVAANEVWVLANADGSGPASWTALAPAGTPPTPRADARAAYDAAHNRLIVFSGLEPCGPADAANFVLTAANGLGGTPAWSQPAPTGAAPANASRQAVAYDASNDRLTVFGGAVGAGFANTTTTLSVASAFGGTPLWQDLGQANAPPPPRAGATAVQRGDRVVLFGGVGANGRLADTWVLETAAGRVVDVPTAGPTETARPLAFAGRPVPNPSAGAVRMVLRVPTQASVELRICDAQGRLVRVAHRGVLAAGEHHLTWDGRDAVGAPAAPGVYFATARAAGQSATVRLLRVR